MMMRRPIVFVVCMILSSVLFVACGSDTTLPTVHPTLNSEPTVDPNLGSGFDPDLGNDDNTAETEPTPTRESDVSTGGDSESGARGSGFTAQITGGSVPNINDGGQYGCNLNGHRIASGASASPNITFTIPTTEAIDTHTLTTSPNIAVQVALASATDSYTQVTDGTVTLDRVPEGAGDFVSGSFNFTIRNSSGTEIGVRGSFDFETSNTAYC